MLILNKHSDVYSKVAIVLACIFVYVFPLDAFAFTPSVCPFKAEKLTESLITCIDGYLSNMIEEFINRFVTVMGNFVATIAVIVIIIYGYRVAMGAINKPIAETVTLVIKLMIVSVFALNADGILVAYRDGVVDAMHIIGDFFSRQLYTSMDCEIVPVEFDPDDPFNAAESHTNEERFRSIFSVFDCALNKVFGFEYINTKNVVIFITVVGGLLYSSFGVQVLMLAVSLVVSMITSVVWTLFLYLQAMFALTILMGIAPLVLPFLLFNKFQIVTERWWKFIIVYSLQPIVATAFLGLMLAVITFMAQQLMTMNHNALELLQDDNAKTHRVMFNSKDISIREQDFDATVQYQQEALDSTLYPNQWSGYNDVGADTFSTLYGDGLAPKPVVDLQDEDHGMMQKLWQGLRRKFENVGYLFHKIKEDGLFAGPANFALEAVASKMLRKHQSTITVPSLPWTAKTIFIWIMYLLTTVLLFLLLEAFLKKIPSLLDNFVAGQQVADLSAVSGGEQWQRNTLSSVEKIANAGMREQHNAERKAFSGIGIGSFVRR